MDSPPHNFDEIEVEAMQAPSGSARPKSRSASQRKRKAKRDATGASASPPSPLPLETIPSPPQPSAPQTTDQSGGGGRSRAWMLANLRSGSAGATVVAVSPEATSEDRAPTVAAPPGDREYPVEELPRTEKPEKSEKKKKKVSSKQHRSPSSTTPGSANTPSTAQHYVDDERADVLSSPYEANKRTATTAAVVDTTEDANASVFDEGLKELDDAAHGATRESQSDSGDSQNAADTKAHRTSGSRAARHGAMTTREYADARDAAVRVDESGRKPRTAARPGQGTDAPGSLDFFALPRMMRLQQTFESHRTQLYNFCATHVVEWPTLAVEWIPDRRFADPERDYTLQYVAVGTQAGRGHQNSVRVLEVAVPVYLNTGAMYNLFGDDDINGATGATAEEFEAMVDPGKLFKNIRGHFHTDQVVAVDSTVLKIKAMPAETNTIAVKTASGRIKIYNLVRELTEGADGLTTPEATLLGHTTGGFGLSWSPAKLGYIASGGDDGYVNYWDVSHHLTAGLDAESLTTAQLTHDPDATGSEVQPIQRLTGHRDVVTEVSCHHSQSHLIASSSMDGDVRIWDTRSSSASNMTIPEAHEGGATAVQFHPFGDFQVATAGTDGAIGLWDIRHSRREVNTLSYHGKAVTGVQWSPFTETVLASHGEDGRVVLWDLSKTTLPMSYSEDAMAPPEVAFVHLGHLGRVTDFSWNPGSEDNWVMASADTMNGLHFYQPRIDVVEDYRVDKQFAGMRR